MNCPNCQNQLKDTARFCTACGLAITGDRWNTVIDSQVLRTHYDPAMDETVVRVDKMIGRLLDSKYELLARLGEGGMGTVYRARRVHIGDQVAVKVLHSKFVAEKDGIERFRREARAAAMLHHPNVVTIHDYGESQGDTAPAFIVMELISGASLRDLLRREGRLSVEYAVALMSTICAGVAAAHRQNIIHRDLKPDNVLVLPAEDEASYCAAKVVDFGIAKLRDLAASHMLTLTSDIIGTPYYMSPEQCRGESLDARSDVYSLGAMMYEMLAGVRPFISHTPTAVISKQLTEPPPPFPKQLGIPAALEAVILRALAKDATHRQSDAAAFSRELRVALSPSAPAVVRESGKAPVERFVVPIGQPLPIEEPKNQAHNESPGNLSIQPPVQPLHPPVLQGAIQPPFQPYAGTPKRSMTGSIIGLIFVILLFVGAVVTLLKLSENQSSHSNVTVTPLSPRSLAPGETNPSKTGDVGSSTPISSANANQSPAVVTSTNETAVRIPQSDRETGKTNDKTAESAPKQRAESETLPGVSIVNVTGEWQSYFGTVRLTQTGSAISGTIRYADGSGTGRIRGSINDRKLAFRWSDDTSTYDGAGAVTLSTDGRALRGSIRLNGETTPLELRR